MENLGKIGQMIKKLTDFKLTFFSLKSATFSVVVDIIYTWALVSSQKPLSPHDLWDRRICNLIATSFKTTKK